MNIVKLYISVLLIFIKSFSFLFNEKHFASIKSIKEVEGEDEKFVVPPQSEIYAGHAPSDLDIARTSYTIQRIDTSYCFEYMENKTVIAFNVWKIIICAIILPSIRYNNQIMGREFSLVVRNRDQLEWCPGEAFTPTSQ
jgi:hypothetical protein